MAISPGATRFCCALQMSASVFATSVRTLLTLVESFEGFGWGGVGDKANIRFVYAHAEGCSCTDNLNAARSPFDVNALFLLL